MYYRIVLIFIFIFKINFGFAQEIDTIKNVGKPKFETKKLIVPLALMTTGTAILATEKRNFSIKENQNFLAFGGFMEDYMQFSPHIAVYAFEWAGMKPKTDVWNRTAILGKSQLISLSSVYVLKKLIKKPRPDASNEFGFPSGHATFVFSGATILSMEYGENYKWIPYVSYGIAGGVSALRVYHDKHYWSDVVFGAGLGILSTKIAYWTHQYQWNRKKTEKDPLTNLYREQL